ncbi:MAG: alpha/beta hydrolase [Chloroflexi bacterium]|nr:MAG: alpha/beta hydrolase [Chloroflexota bacterium]
MARLTSPVRRPIEPRCGRSNGLPVRFPASRSSITWSPSASPPVSRRNVTGQAAWRRVRRPDGGELEVLSEDSADQPLVFHWGTPGAAVWFEPLATAAAHAGLRFVTYSRPGYAGSTPRPGRSVADAAADVAAILDALGADTFVTLGWSGGGPHAVACAALLPDRCAAAASLAGVAPYGGEGLDWLAGMGPENIEEFSAAVEGESALNAAVLKMAGELKTVQGADVAAALGGLVSDVDKRALTGEFADILAESFRRSVSTGVAGWRDDDLAFTRSWGFDLGSIRRPVAVWQGGQDRMVPFAHGQWLAAHIPSARVHLYPDEGHLSLGVASLDRIVADLARLGSEARV